MSDNIIEFPKKKSNPLEIDGNDEQSVFFAELGFHVALDIIQVLHDNEYYVENNPQCIRDIFLIIEAVRALGYRSINEDYTMQKISDHTFNFFEDEEKMLLDLLDTME